MLAGHDEHDPWGLDQLFNDAIHETGARESNDIPTIERIIVDWTLARMESDTDTQAAVQQLATVHSNHLELSSLGVFTGFDDEWQGGWGSTEAVLVTEARKEMERIIAKAADSGD